MTITVTTLKTTGPGSASYAGRELSFAEHAVLTERRRQVDVEGWSTEHDDEHGDGSLALAAACYAEGPSGRSRVATFTDDVSGGRGDTPVWGKRKVLVPAIWPRSWCASWWKPSEDRRRDLVKAAALLLAEIERLDRERTRSSEPASPSAAMLDVSAPGDADRRD